MTPRQMYRELSKLTRILGSDNEPMLASRKFGREAMDELANGMMCLFEKLDASRARHDFGRNYARRRQTRAQTSTNVDGTSEEEEMPLRGGLMPSMTHIDEAGEVHDRTGTGTFDLTLTSPGLEEMQRAMNNAREREMARVLEAIDRDSFAQITSRILGLTRSNEND